LNKNHPDMEFNNRKTTAFYWFKNRSKYYFWFRHKNKWNSKFI